MQSQDRRTFLMYALATPLACSAFQSPTFARSVAPADLHYASATELAEWLESRKVTSLQIVNAILDRQHAVNKTLNAVITPIDPEKIREQAKQADRRADTGKRRSPLDGIPCTIKDNIKTADIRTTNGCPELEHYIPARDATLVARLKRAGVIILGKTNVPEMCMDGDTDNILFGRTHNPYNLDHVPGGSSGGEAAIIAAGGSVFGVGTDIGGSIRSPSHCCGIAGIKPTSGRVPDTGVFNSFHPSFWRWNGTGPMARRVRDLSLILSTIHGPDGLDSRAVHVRLRDAQRVKLDRLKILGIPADGFSEPDETTRMVFQNAMGELQGNASVAQEVLPRFHEGFDRWVFSQVPDWSHAIRGFRERYAKLGNSDQDLEHHYQVEWLLKFLGECEPEFDDSRQFDEKLKLREYADHITSAVSSFDVIVTPVSNGPAQKPITADSYAMLGKDDFESFKSGGDFCQTFNILGWPAVVVRCGTSEDGLPIGLQVVAKPWREDLALAVAAFLEDALGGWKAPTLDLTS